MSSRRLSAARLRDLASAAALALLAVCTSDAPHPTAPPPTRALTAVPAPRSLASAAPDLAAMPAILIGAGNVATCSGNGDERTAGILDTVPGVVFTTGNAAYPNGSDSAYTYCFAPQTTWGRHKARVLPAAGDQDYKTVDAAGYFDYFGAAAGVPAQGYYSYDLGAWHVVVLNSNLSMAAGSPQEQWLRIDLAANPRVCTLAYWQLPLYSSGQSGRFTTARPLWDALYDYGADVVLGGKDRDYERFAPQDPSGNLDPAKGIRQFVVGTGGAGNSSSFRTTIMPNSEVRYLAADALLKLTLNATSYSWVLIPAKGLPAADSGTTTCVGATSNQPPVAAVAGPYTGDEGAAIAFDGSGSSDPDGDALTYDWDFGDGSAHGSGARPTHAYFDNGTYTLVLTVSDPSGARSSASSTTVTVVNVPPVATFAAPGTVAEGSPIEISLTNPLDPSSADASAGFTYAFDCGAGAGYGEYGSANSTSCPTADNGTRALRASIRDKDGATTEYTATVAITNVAPIVQLPRDTLLQLAQSFSLTASFADPGARDGPWGYVVTWGDGGAATTGTAPQPGAVTAGHIYTAAGAYTVTLRVADKDSASGSASLVVTINAPPEISSTGGPYAGAEGSGLTLTASASDPDGDALTYDWDFGDGSPHGASASVAHAFRDDGTYTVTLTVRDAHGDRAEAATTAVIANAPPVLGSITGPPMPFVGDPISVSASFSDAGVADTHVATIDWGDGFTTPASVSESNGTGSATGAHSYAAAGTYAIRVSVTDNGGAVASGSLTVSVTAPPNRPPIANAGGPYAGTEGASISLAGSAQDPEGDAMTFAWDFGDGSPRASGATPTHEYADNGTYTVTLVVTDDKGNAGTPATTTVTIANVPPAATFVAPGSGTEGAAFSMSLTAPHDVAADMATLTYAFDCGAGSGFGEFGATSTTTCVPTSAGSRTVKGQVRDKDGGVSEYVAVVSVANVAPVVDAVGFSANPVAALVPVTASGAFSDAGAADVHTATVDWGDGTDGAAMVNESDGRGSATGSHSYAAAGSYVVRLTVTDNSGGTASSTATLVVTPPANRPPTAVPGPSYAGVEGAPIAFDGSGSSDPDGDALTYDWDFGDGSAHGTGATPTHTYRDNGSFEVTLVVTDSKGLAGALATTTATVANAAPAVGRVTLSPDPVTVGVPVSATANFTDAGTVDTHTSSVDWGDGTSGAGSVSESNGSGTVSASHTYASAGSYTVRISVTDNAGGVGSSSATLTVTPPPNRPPIALAGGAYAGVEAGTLTFDGSGSSDPDGDALTYDWNWGDGTAHGTTVRPTHAYPDNGTYTVTLTVTDSHGLVSTPVATTAIITNVAPTVGALSGPSGSVLVKAPVTMSASFTDPGRNDTHTASFDWGDGGTSAASVTEAGGAGSASGTHSYSMAGTFTARLTVIDKDGGSGTAARTVTIVVGGDSVIVVGAGDIATCGGSGMQQTARILDTIPGTVFVAGDGSNENGTYTQYASCYNLAWGRHKARTRPATGNHDYNTSGASGYFDYFDGVGANDGPAGARGKGYYSYDTGSWHVVVLNSNIATSAGSAQEQWLRADLALNTKQCTLAYWHHPRFNSGPVGNSNGLQPLWQALYDYGAEIVVNGHEHLYERFAPQTPTGGADPARGIRQFTVGIGGAGNVNRWGSTKPNSEVRYLSDFGVLRLTLRNGSYAWRLITVSKGFSDSGSGTCH